MTQKTSLKTLLMAGLLLVLTAGVLRLPASLAAQENTDNSQGENSETTNTLRERIQNIVEQQKEKVQSVLGEITNQRRGFIGQVVRVSEETLGLEIRGATRIVPLDETVVLMRNGAEIAPENIEVGSWAMVLGTMKSDSAFVPRKVTFTPTSLLPDTHIVYLGTIEAIKTGSIDFQPRGKEETLTVDITNATLFQDSDGEETLIRNFVEDDQVLLIGYQDEEDTVATVIRALAPFSRDQ